VALKATLYKMDKHIKELRKRSGAVTYKGQLTSFLYELMRDVATPGEIEKIVNNSPDEPVLYTNGWLAEYAADLAKRLGEDPERIYPETDERQINLFEEDEDGKSKKN